MSTLSTPTQSLTLDSKLAFVSESATSLTPIEVNIQRLLPALLIGHVMVLVLMWFVGDELPPELSLLAVSLITLGGLLVVYNLYLKHTLGTSILGILILAFTVRLGIGIAHYLIVMDPHYFEHPAQFQYLWDYQWMHQSMIDVKAHWQIQGFLADLPNDFVANNKNSVIMAYNSLLYYFSGTNALNLAAWNTLHSLYTACIVSSLAFFAGANRKQAVLAFTVAAFQPFGIISSMFWRDAVGQTLLVLALYLLIVVRKRPLLWLLIIPTSLYLASLTRGPYLFLMALTAPVIIFGRTISPNKFSLRSILFIFASIIAVVFISIPSVSSSLTGILGAHYSGIFSKESDSTFSLLTKLMRGIIGPFPWFQIFIVEYPEYMPADFLQSVLNVVLYIIAIPFSFKLWAKTSVLDASLFLGVAIFLVAVLQTSSNVHSSYVSIGSVFLIPMACQARKKMWYLTLLLVSQGFIVANLLYWLFDLMGSNISSSV